MASLTSAVQELYRLEELAEGDSCIHRRHSLCKLLSTMIYVATVVSFPPYALGRLLPFLFYPVVLAALSDTPWKPLWRRIALALPFVVLAGASNLVLERESVCVLLGVPVSAGAVSCLTILLRTVLCVAAVLLLAATTPLWSLTDSLRRLHVPQVFLTLLEITYRYIGALLEEAGSMTRAYLLRSPGRRGLEMRHMGSFAGQLLLRSFDRAQRVYHAMQCRGFALKNPAAPPTRFRGVDWGYLAATAVPCLLLRLIDVPALLTRALEGLL